MYYRKTRGRLDTERRGRTPRKPQHNMTSMKPATEQAQVTETQVCPPGRRRSRSLVAKQLLTLFSLLLLPQSLTLMRNLLRTGISTICYMREIFGDEEFSVRIWSSTTAASRSLPLVLHAPAAATCTPVCTECARCVCSR